MNIDDKLINIINNLTRAVNVCYAVDYASSEEREKNWDLQYPFATGYSRSAMNQTIDDLNQIVSELRKDLV